MWIYEKRLQYPVNIKETNADLATAIISQYGGPDGEAGASLRYLSQRYSMPYREIIGTLTDIGTEELGHMEMVASVVQQLTRNLSMEEIQNSPFAAYYTDHTVGIYPQAASGVPFSASTLQCTGDTITDLMEDMAAEQKARLTYDNILRLCRDYPDVYEVIKFLRAREIVHFQRFGESLRIAQDNLNKKNYYAFNPGFDRCAPCLKKELDCNNTVSYNTRKESKMFDDGNPCDLEEVSNECPCKSKVTPSCNQHNMNMNSCRKSCNKCMKYNK